MSNTIEFDLLIYRLHSILRESVYCEDNELRIKNKAKYDIFNLIEEIDKQFIDELKKELEYEEN